MPFAHWAAGRSFREAKDTLALLGCGNISVSKLRKETLLAGEAALAELFGVA